MEQDNTSKELVVYSDSKLGFLVETYAGEAGIMTWIHEANNKLNFPELDKDYEEKEQDGQGHVAYFDADSNSEVESLSSEEYEGDKSNNEDHNKSY